MTYYLQLIDFREDLFSRGPKNTFHADKFSLIWIKFTKIQQLKVFKSHRNSQVLNPQNKHKYSLFFQYEPVCHQI